MFPKCLLSSRLRYIIYMTPQQAFPLRSSFPPHTILPFLLTSPSYLLSYIQPHPLYLHTVPSFCPLIKWHQLTSSSNLRVSNIPTHPFLPLDNATGYWNLVILLLLSSPTVSSFVQDFIAWLVNSEPNRWLLISRSPHLISSSTLSLLWCLPET